MLQSNEIALRGLNGTDFFPPFEGKLPTVRALATLTRRHVARLSTQDPNVETHHVQPTLEDMGLDSPESDVSSGDDSSNSLPGAPLESRQPTLTPPKILYAGESSIRWQTGCLRFRIGIAFSTSCRWSAGEDEGALCLDSLHDGPQRSRFARSGITLKNSQPILRG
jgi:hypothetical protein